MRGNVPRARADKPIRQPQVKAFHKHVRNLLGGLRLNGLQERLRNGFLGEEHTVEAGELDIHWESLVSLEAALAELRLLVHHFLEA